MILLADSGSTKTGWALMDKHSNLIIQGTGLHPAFHTDDSLRHGIQAAFPESFAADEVTQVYFFGSGCLRSEPAARMETILQETFKNASIQVSSDLEGAALATLGHRQGVVAILGTGSSAASWDGQKLDVVSPSLGYLLGDEGSGADLGKALLVSVFYGEVTTDLHQAFKIYDSRTTAEIINEINTTAHPGRYLASFVPFIAAHIHNPEIKAILSERFQLFINRQIKPLSSPAAEVHLCGGIAFEFSGIIEECLRQSGLMPGNIVKSPLNGLIALFRSQYFNE